MHTGRAPVIVLAGGKSTRLGRDKASEVLAGKSLLQRAIDASEEVASHFVVVTARGQRLPEVRTGIEMTVIEDVFPATGPLGGIYTGLQAIEASAEATSPASQHRRFALVVACDMPLLQPALLRELVALATGHDAVVPVRDGQPEPLCAAYSMSCAGTARRLLERGEYKVAGLLRHVAALFVPETHWRAFDPEGLSFLNVNREADLETARSLIERG